MVTIFADDSQLLGLIRVADSSGPEMDQAALTRYLNETIWFPTACLSDYIRWETIDSNSAKPTVSVKNVTASAVFYFDEKGELTNFIAERYMDENGQLVLRTWSAPINGGRPAKTLIEQ